MQPSKADLQQDVAQAVATYREQLDVLKVGVQSVTLIEYLFVDCANMVSPCLAATASDHQGQGSGGA